MFGGRFRSADRLHYGKILIFTFITRFCRAAPCLSLNRFLRKMFSRGWAVALQLVWEKRMAFPSCSQEGAEIVGLFVAAICAKRWAVWNLPPQPAGKRRCTLTETGGAAGDRARRSGTKK